MSIKQPNIISNPPKVGEEIARRKLPFPFKIEKKIRGHTDNVFDSVCVTFPDGDTRDTRIITCSEDLTLRIFNLETQKCERVIEHTRVIYSVHFYKEEQVLMTTDAGGELNIWKLFPKIKIIKKIKVAERESILWPLTQISSTEFFCCVENGNSKGNLYKIKFNKNNNDNKWISEEIEYPTYNNNEKKEDLNCVYQLISQKNIILFAGGDLKKEGGVDFTIKSIDLYNNNKFKRFPKKHSEYIKCLTSFISTKNKEIIISGGDDKIMSWNLEGEYLKEIKFNGPVNCFLNDFSRNNILIVGGYKNAKRIYSYSLKTREFKKIAEKIHKKAINSLKWINEDQNQFISCSQDKTFNIYELKEVLIRIEGNLKIFDFLYRLSQCKIEFKNKEINILNIFMNHQKIKKKKEIFRKFKSLKTNIDEETIQSISLGNKFEIPFDQLTEYYNFFRIIDIKHCIAAVHRKIEKIESLEKVYFLFKKFCLKYENEVVRSWFTMNLEEEENITPRTFDTSFALSLFNKMKKMGIQNEKIGLEMIKKDIFFGQVWVHLGKFNLSEMINIIDHKDFEGVRNENELTAGGFFKKLYENRSSNFNLTLVSTDKKEFKVLKEIMILRYDFFYRMFKFGGLEVTEYEKRGKITLIGLMSSDVVECLISYAYLGKLINSKRVEFGVVFSTFCKLLIFCDQYNERELMKKVRSDFENFVSSFDYSEANSSNNNNKKEKENVVNTLSEFSNFLIGNDKLMRIIAPLSSDFGVRMSGAHLFFEDLVLQNMKLREEKEEFADRERQLTEINSILQNRILELEELVGGKKKEGNNGNEEVQIKKGKKE